MEEGVIAERQAAGLFDLDGLVGDIALDADEDPRTLPAVALEYGEAGLEYALARVVELCSGVKDDGVAIFLTVADLDDEGSENTIVVVEIELGELRGCVFLALPTAVGEHGEDAVGIVVSPYAFFIGIHHKGELCIELLGLGTDLLLTEIVKTISCSRK